MRALYPQPAAEVDAAEWYALPPGGAPHLRVNMVSSVDGAAAVEGRVGLLSGSADQVLLHELRSLCDVLLVGAGTVRAEGYGPIRLNSEQRLHREREGMQAMPRLAVLSRSLSLDLAGPAFTSATARPLLVTTERASRARVREAEEVAEVVVTGGDDVDLTRAVEVLAERGMPRILSEGGPHVLAQLFAADLVDDLCLAVAPVVTCGSELRITAGPPLPVAKTLGLAHVLEKDEFLFLRYRRAPAR